MRCPCVAVNGTQPGRRGSERRHEPFRNIRQPPRFNIRTPFKANDDVPCLAALAVVVVKEGFGVEKNFVSNPVAYQRLLIGEVAHTPHRRRIPFYYVDNRLHFLTSAARIAAAF